MNIVVFDLETKLRPGQDCSWEQKGLMGISVGCAFSYATGDTTVHLDDNLPDLWDLIHRADLVAGYNIIEFDLPLLKATMIAFITDRPDIWKDPAAMLAKIEEQYAGMQAKAYDVYLEAKAGAKVDKFARGFKCDEVLRATWGAQAGKTGNGAMAPDLYKQKRMGELISYCLGDVHRERRLFERCWNEGTLRTMGVGNGETWFPVRRPWELELPAGRFDVGAQLPFRIDVDPCAEVALPPPAPEPTIPAIAPPIAYPSPIAPSSSASDDI